MKQIMTALLTGCLLASCAAGMLQVSGDHTVTGYTQVEDSPITRSLFSDKSSTISEENIQRILTGHYELPQELRVAIVKLESTQRQGRSYYWTDESYMKSQQAYLDSFTAMLKDSRRVSTVSIVPDLLISANPTFTIIREAAVRTQSDIVLVYSIASDIYSNYRLFSKPEVKAFATTQCIVLDVRTGLIPFSTIITKDFHTIKQKEEFSDSEMVNRAKNGAIQLTIEEIGKQVMKFLSME